MSIWIKPVSVATLTQAHERTAVGHLGIEFLEVGPDFLRARVPVDHRTRQPLGLLHGGVSVTLAETLGSSGANYASAPGLRAVGLEVNANHIRSATAGWVTGLAKPLHLGRRTQVWQIELRDDADALTAIARITMALLERGRPEPAS